MAGAVGIATIPTVSLSVMAGLVPAIHVLLLTDKDVDARDKPGHDAERVHFVPNSLLYDA